MGRVHRFLGLTVGVIQSDKKAHEKRHAYACDITYATSSVRPKPRPKPYTSHMTCYARPCSSLVSSRATRSRMRAPRPRLRHHLRHQLGAPLALHLNTTRSAESDTQREYCKVPHEKRHAYACDITYATSSVCPTLHTFSPVPYFLHMACDAECPPLA